MAQQRDPPAYQEYAASLMARAEYRAMSLCARGLFVTLRYECWVNRELPADVATLAKILGFTVEQINDTLPEVMPFFRFDADKLRCPELDNYRAELDERRDKQSRGGRVGAAKTNSGRGGVSTSTPTGKPRAGRESLVQINSEKKSQTQANQGGGTDKEWINEYTRASRGY